LLNIAAADVGTVLPINKSPQKIWLKSRPNAKNGNSHKIHLKMEKKKNTQDKTKEY